VTGIVWWEIETPEPVAFQAFHGDLWGWTFAPAFVVTELGADYWIIKSAGQSLGGLQRAPLGTAPPQAGTRLYLELEVPDLEGTLRQAAGLGALTERGRTPLGGPDRWFAIVRDPSGVSFGLWTPNDRRPA
jgi:predicted enzyme related to lactoylglutathione lyase